MGVSCGPSPGGWPPPFAASRVCSSVGGSTRDSPRSGAAPRPGTTIRPDASRPTCCTGFRTSSLSIGLASSSLVIATITGVIAAANTVPSFHRWETTIAATAEAAAATTKVCSERLSPPPVPLPSAMRRGYRDGSQPWRGLLAVLLYGLDRKVGPVHLGGVAERIEEVLQPREVVVEAESPPVDHRHLVVRHGARLGLAGTSRGHEQVRDLGVGPA